MLCDVSTPYPMETSITEPTIIPLDAIQIASLALQDIDKPEIQLQSTQLRITFVEQWKIKPGSRVLEIGCGQGDCTAVLATAVGENGHVTALDPAPPDYGVFRYHSNLITDIDKTHRKSLLTDGSTAASFTRSTGITNYLPSGHTN
jgi:predicted methyltransferase